MNPFKKVKRFFSSRKRERTISKEAEPRAIGYRARSTNDVLSGETGSYDRKQRYSVNWNINVKNISILLEVAITLRKYTIERMHCGRMRTVRVGQHWSVCAGEGGMILGGGYGPGVGQVRWTDKHV